MSMRARKKILLICSEPFAGAYAYLALGVLDALKGDDYETHFLYQRCDESYKYEGSISDDVLKIPFSFGEGSRYRRFLSKIFPISLIYRILRLFRMHNYVVAHNLSTGYALANVFPFMPKTIRLIQTIHDADPHGKSGGVIFSYINYAEKLSQFRCHELATCSKSQLKILQERYPKKNVGYFRMPSHISQSIIEGKSLCPELENEKNYVLFFGILSPYKGVDLLIEAFLNTEIQAKLVIAGTSGVGCGVDIPNSPRIIRIDRFIDDSEVKSLFENAKCVVYPYVSITQTAVVQFAFYFKIPVICSNLPYFCDCVRDEETGLLFEKGDSKALENSINCIFGNSFDLHTMQSAQEKEFKESYAPQGLRAELLQLYFGKAGTPEG